MCPTICAYSGWLHQALSPGKNNKFVSVIYDTKVSGMASARSHIRIVNFREQHCKSSVKGVVKALSDSADTLPEGVFFHMLDGCVHGHELKLMKAFTTDEGKSMAKDKRTLYLACSEKSMRARRSRVRGAVPLSCVEYCHIVSKTAVDMPSKNRMHMQGSTSSDFLGPFDVPGNDAVWSVEAKLKPTIYGSGYVECGGAVPGDDPSSDPAPKPSDMVPLPYFTNSPLLYAELDHAANASAWVDCTACDEGLAMLCIRQQKPYLGFCFSEKHKAMLQERLHTVVFQAFQTIGDSLHEAGLCELLKISDPKPDETVGTGTFTGAGTGAGTSTETTGAGTSTETTGGGGTGTVPTPPGLKGGAGCGRAGGAASRQKLLATLKAMENGGTPEASA